MAKDPSLSTVKLWPHQSEALDRIRRYLRAAHNHHEVGSALIHMPTGTGKSGVIACTSHFLSTRGAVLILSPRVALRDQLAEEIGGRFFEKLGLTRTLPKNVKNVKQAWPITIPDYSHAILVCSIQKLQSMHRNQAPEYSLLQKEVGLVIIDEGHYEPAVTWSEAIRGIQKPKVLFTATPFRNDLKIFDINLSHAYSYSFQDAVSKRIIRKVQVHHRSKHNNADEFIEDVIRFYDSQFPTAHTDSDPPRVIIRCDSDTTIRQIGQRLELAGKSYVLIHENFGVTSNPHETKAVPDPQLETATFWVHQFKLLEGIDDHRFQIVAIFEELDNTRSLVQQIGRVVRNPGRKQHSVGHFLDHSNGHHSELWNDFMTYDSIVKKEGLAVVDFNQNIVEAVKQAQPEIMYIDNRFRSPLALETLDPRQELMLPQTANIMRKLPAFRFAEVCSEIESYYAKIDRFVTSYPIDPATHALVYLDFRNSTLLRSKCFIECRLGVTIVRDIGEFVCSFDSFGGIPSGLSERCSVVSIDELQRLFPKNDQTYLTSVSLSNADLGQRSVRTKSVSAARVEDVLPAFDDHAFACRTVRGKSLISGEAKSVRRYVGFETAKITDYSIRRVEFAKYIAWLDRLTAVLSTPTPIASGFERFAKPVGPPLDCAPKHILLDVKEIESIFHSAPSFGAVPSELLSVEDACSIVQSGEFSVTANGRAYNGTINFDGQRYQLDIPGLDQDFESEDAKLAPSVVGYLNRTQSFRVIPTTVGSFYTLGSFYKPVLQFGSSYNDDQIGLLKVLHARQRLGTIKSEKGLQCDPNGLNWDPDCLFSIIDKLGDTYNMTDVFKSPDEPDIMVCDDMGREVADFILGYSNQSRVIFIHCKGMPHSQPASKYSASNLHDVCGQATKNLRYFSRFEDVSPPRSIKWHTDEWEDVAHVSGKVIQRVRRGSGNGEDIWRKLQSIIRNPYATLEVWLFLGRLLSKSKFTSQLTKRKPAVEAQQAAYLLFSTMNDVAAVGARFKVFCSE